MLYGGHSPNEQPPPAPTSALQSARAPHLLQPQLLPQHPTTDPRSPLSAPLPAPIPTPLLRSRPHSPPSAPLPLLPPPTLVCSLPRASRSAVPPSPCSLCRMAANLSMAAATSGEASSARARSCQVMALSVRHCRASPSGKRTGSFCRATRRARMVSKRGRRERWHRGHRNLASHSHQAGEGFWLAKRGQATQEPWNQSRHSWHCSMEGPAGCPQTQDGGPGAGGAGF